MLKGIGTLLCVAALSGLLAGEAEAKPRAHGFRTGHCKRASCFAKHPGGSYVYPLTGRRHRR